MGRAGRAALAAVVLLAGYAAADAYDVVPGVLTTAEPVPDPAPYPTPTYRAAPLTLTTPDPAAPRPDPAALAALTDELLADERIGPSAGVLVVDALTGERLVDVEADVPRTPASSVKVLGALAALDALGPDHVLTTQVVAGGPGEVVLVGGGDILLAAGAGDEGAVVGHAGLADLAEQTAAALAGTGSVRVRLDDTLFTGPALNPGWGGIDLDFVMPIQPVAVETGLDPAGGYLPDPALAAAQTFAAALAAQGVAVDGAVERAAAPAGAQVLATVESAPVEDIVAHTLRVSDNSLSEVLARLVAVSDGGEGSTDGAIAAVLDHLAGFGIDVSGVSLADTSGLLVENVVPPAVLADVVTTALDPVHPQLRAAADLPVAGLEGTLARRFAGPAAGVLQAKTGTLTTAVSLTGAVLDADGRLLVLSVVADDVPFGGASAAREAVDEWATALAGCGCR
ncbi:D-alanyl-D-alanine carboxypeptidase/D-alanyl-D-alanine-endopeptidase [Georgenia faecalis]|uniref:D-alanyl-D-alanine carboxypeptidase/D-alanyl-D-alanine-endopeptidase n=1 Tax=Georgenia faecalis TaxID=2483799 RepID=A0ABV9DBY6_9MICO|nr:D-alanyl-D-alanine carboxypeptidase/D-alanyl-D-alanine-endopeptidase [Georgenia faecalis]